MQGCRPTPLWEYVDADYCFNPNAKDLPSDCLNEITAYLNTDEDQRLMVLTRH